jgi:hypothetical protein
MTRKYRGYELKMVFGWDQRTRKHTALKVALVLFVPQGVNLNGKLVAVSLALLLLPTTLLIVDLEALHA